MLAPLSDSHHSPHDPTGILNVFREKDRGRARRSGQRLRQEAVRNRGRPIGLAYGGVRRPAPNAAKRVRKMRRSRLEPQESHAELGSTTGTSRITDRGISPRHRDARSPQQRRRVRPGH
jgi:hypothetical protein